MKMKTMKMKRSTICVERFFFKNFLTSSEFLYRVSSKKSTSNLKCSPSKKFGVDLNKIFTVVKIFHCLHLEVFIEVVSWGII